MPLNPLRRSHRHAIPPRRWARRATVAFGLAALVTPAAVASAGAPASADQAGATISSTGLQPGQIKHVWLIILENKSYDATFTGLNQNSYLWKTLPSQGVLLRNYFGTSHYSQGNYTTLVSGQATQQDLNADCDVSVKDFNASVVTSPGSNYGQAASAQGPYTGVPNDPARDGQNGCVYQSPVPTLFNQLDSAGVSWKGYAQDLGAQAGREDGACGSPGTASNNPTTNPTNEQGSFPPGVSSYTGAQSNDQYVAKHFPFPWFHSLVDNASDCDGAHIANLDGPTGAYTGSGLVADLAKPADQVPAFNWITPDNCSDAHDAVCRGNNLSGAFNADGTPNYAAGPYLPESTTPANYTGGLYASDLFLRYYIPLIEQSAAFKDGGLIDVTFDEANPPFTYTGNSFYNSSAVPADATTGLASDASGWTLGGDTSTYVPSGPNNPLGVNALGNPDPGPGNNAFIDRQPARARTDTNGLASGNGQRGGSVAADPSSNVVTDAGAVITDQGRAVTDTVDTTGPGGTSPIPPGTYVGSVSDTGTTATAPYQSGGQAVAGSFTLVDGSGNPVKPTGTVTSVTLAARSTSGTNADPLYDPTSWTTGGGDVGSVLISPYITPGSVSDRFYNHYSWLRTMEDIFRVSTGSSQTQVAGGAGSVSGGLDGAGHLGYAATPGLAPFGPDVFNHAGSGN